MTSTVVAWGIKGPHGWIWSRRERVKFFAHRDDLVDVTTLEPGEKVEFEAIETGKGPRARNVHPLPARATERGVGAVP